MRDRVISQHKGEKVMSTKNTPVVSGATGEQIEHIMDMWRRRLRSRNLTLDEGNQIIRNGGAYHPTMDAAADLLVDKVRSDIANTVVRMVRNIRRSRTPMQAIDATRRSKYVDDSIVATMPVGDGPEEAELVYFHLGRYVSEDDLAKEYETLGLVPDSQAQCADNEADPAFADAKPNGSQWKDGKKWNFVAFSRRGGGRGVGCVRIGRGWIGSWWFAGRRKS